MSADRVDRTRGSLTVSQKMEATQMEMFNSVGFKLLIIAGSRGPEVLAVPIVCQN